MHPSVLEPACLKTSQGREERMRERQGERRGSICADTTSHGALGECVKVCGKDGVGEENCQRVNL